MGNVLELVSPLDISKSNFIFKKYLTLALHSVIVITSKRNEENLMDHTKLKEAQDIISGIISTIFLNEDDFKSKVLSHYLKSFNSSGDWIPALYDIVSCHSASKYRFLLCNHNHDHLEVYVKSADIFDWFDEVHKENLASWVINTDEVNK